MPLPLHPQRRSGRASRATNDAQCKAGEDGRLRSNRCKPSSPAFLSVRASTRRAYELLLTGRLARTGFLALLTTLRAFLLALLAILLIARLLTLLAILLIALL